MNPLLEYLKKATAEIVATAEKKNADYTGGSADPFANFNAVELLGIASAETGILVRLTDKLMRVRGFVENGVLKVTDETIEDTLKDAACYSLILGALIKHRREQGVNNGRRT